MDVHNLQQRSKNMRAIKASGTKPELLMAKALWAKGYRYCKNNKSVFGKPDFTFKKFKVAIFVDSEFFHGKDFFTKKKPATNTEFWEKKILRNMERDQQVNEKLTDEGWKIMRFWSREVITNLEEVIFTIENEIKTT